MNSVTTWRMRMEGAQDSRTPASVLAHLGALGTEEDSKSPAVLAAMVRRAVAQNPNVDDETLRVLVADNVPDVAVAARETQQARG